MTHSLRALVLPAFTRDDGPCEFDRWLDGYAFDGTLDVPGVPEPLHYTDSGLGVVPTGMGKAAAATSTTALLSAPDVDLTDALVCSVGIAGTAPSVGTIGSVFIADAVVDWDLKYHCADPGEKPGTTTATVGPLPYTEGDPVYRLDSDLVETAIELTGDVTLTDDDSLVAVRNRHGHPDAIPQVGVGPTVSGDEYWHGVPLAGRVEELLDTYGVDTYCTTQMEDVGTAAALDRFGRLDSYLSVRAAINFDRPPEGVSAHDHFSAGDRGVELDVGLENAYRVGSRIVDHALETE